MTAITSKENALFVFFCCSCFKNEIGSKLCFLAKFFLTNCLETSVLIYLTYYLNSFYMNSKDIESIKRNGNTGRKRINEKGGEGGGRDGKGEKERRLLVI